uniref:Uncharacterized protein n=1 Tax=Branchiostoma floridae TaxID=7739 RepID=C3Y0Z3_BRAFL|eukprot:XP_002610116.1 hypothetical protein BRAFLDRAFT_89848 [Branchiostoma floridae]
MSSRQGAGCWVGRWVLAVKVIRPDCGHHAGAELSPFLITKWLCHVCFPCESRRRVYRKCEKERKGTKRNEKERKGTKRNEKERKGTKRNEKERKGTKRNEV